MLEVSGFPVILTVKEDEIHTKPLWRVLAHDIGDFKKHGNPAGAVVGAENRPCAEAVHRLLVRPWPRIEMGGEAEPVEAYVKSGYQQKIEKARD